MREHIHKQHVAYTHGKTPAGLPLSSGYTMTDDDVVYSE